MSPQGLLKGEELEITGFVATVAHTYGGGVWLTFGEGGYIFIDDAAYAAMDVTRRTVPKLPSQWPPRRGDMWQAGTDRWVAVAHDEFETGTAMMRIDDSTRRVYYAPGPWLDHVGTPTLAYRVGYEMPTDEPTPSQTPVTDALAAAGWIEPDKRPYYEKAFDNVGDSVTANGQHLADAGPADEPGGWMRPGEGSIYTQGPAAEACADDADADNVPLAEPDVDTVQPWEIETGDRIRVPGPAYVTVVDRDHDTAGSYTFWYERDDGREGRYTVLHGGAVARVRKAAKARTIRADEVRPGDVIKLSKLTLEHTVKSVEPVDDGERVRYVLEDDGPFYSFADAQVWLVRRAGESR